MAAADRFPARYPADRRTWRRGRADPAAPVEQTAAPVGVLAMPRRRGLGAGIVLLILGIWGGISPLVGPTFGYRADTAGSWAVTWDRWWLSMLPAIVVIVGALILIVAGDRLSGVVGASLALAGGIWLVIGPSVALLWGRPLTPAGAAGSATLRFLEQFGMFYGLGAVITAVAAGTWARVLVRSRRDAAILSASAEVIEPVAAPVDDVVPGPTGDRYITTEQPVAGAAPVVPAAPDFVERQEVVERPAVVPPRTADEAPIPDDGARARHSVGTGTAGTTEERDTTP